MDGTVTQQSPAATAKALFERLVQNYPGEFQDGQLRTLQRRIRQWRQTMARTLIFSGGQEATAVAVGTDQSLASVGS